MWDDAVQRAGEGGTSLGSQSRENLVQLETARLDLI
jgi:hypothetical protein